MSDTNFALVWLYSAFKLILLSFTLCREKEQQSKISDKQLKPTNMTDVMWSRMHHPHPHPRILIPHHIRHAPGEQWLMLSLQFEPQCPVASIPKLPLQIGAFFVLCRFH